MNVNISLNLIVNVLLNVMNAKEMNSIILTYFFFFFSYEQECTVFVAKLFNKIFLFFTLWSRDISKTYHTFNVTKVFLRFPFARKKSRIIVSCSCKAGKGICNCKVVLMYRAAHHSLRKIEAVPEVPPKTSMPQERHHPRSAGIHPEAVDNLIIRKPELKSARSGPYA